MSSIHGTDTSYGAIDKNYLALALDCSETLFGTDINYCNIVHTMKLKDGQENNPEVIKAYTEWRDHFNYEIAKSIQVDAKKTPDTIYDCLQRIPECSEIVKWINSVEYGQHLSMNYPTTFIAPINSVILYSQKTWLRTKQKGILRALLKAHTLDYILSPTSLEGKMLRVSTKCKPFSFIADCTHKITKECTFFQESVTLLSNEYNRIRDRFNILKIIVTKNGIIYIIDGIFSPENIMYAY